MIDRLSYSIRKNRLKIYFIDFYRHGKRIRRSLKTRDRIIARRRAKTVIETIAGAPKVSRISIEQFTSSFESWAEARFAHGHFLNIRTALKLLRESFPALHYLSEISFPLADEFITKLHKSRTERGVNFYLRTYRSIFNYALEHGYIAENPFIKVRRLREPDLRPRVLSIDEIKSFIVAINANAPEFLPLFGFYLLTGLRLSEALNLSWSDIDFDRQTLSIIGKGRKLRAVPLMPAARQLLLNRRSEAKPFGAFGGPSHVSHIFTFIKKKAALDDIKLHDFRKTFSSLLADMNVSEFFIQKWLGHSDSAVTKLHYIGQHDVRTSRKLKAFEKALLDSGLNTLVK